MAAALRYDRAWFCDIEEASMKIDRRIICGALLVAVLLTGCDTSNQPATATATPSNVMTSQPAAPPGAAYPAPAGYPAPGSPTVTAYPAPTRTP
jgi:hypothetical protein